MKKHLLPLILSMTTLAMVGCTTTKPAATNAETTVAGSDAAETTKKDGEGENTENVDKKDSQEKKSTAPIKLPEYHFTRENFPRMDGSTATVPLGKALAGVLLNEEPEKTADLCRFNRTTQSFRNLLAGEADILIVGEPNAKVFEEMDEADFKYQIENFATDALIFVVNEDNPVNSLTTEQIKDIYTGKITNWKEVGGNDAEIVPFQRNEGAGSQALIKKLIMKDTEMMEAPSGLVASEMGELMTAVKSYDNSANAIGYSVYYYANDMKMANGLKIIGVDGVDPNPDTIRNETYPHRNAYYCVIPEDTDPGDERAKGARVIYDWFMTEDGQRLIASKGYVSIMDVSSFGDNASDGKTPHSENFTRLNDAPAGALTEVEPGNDYGMLLPYDGSALYYNYGNEDNDEDYSYIAGYMRGFFDINGRLVTDPVYNSIEKMDYYDPLSYNQYYLPYYRAVKYDETGVPVSSDEEYYGDESMTHQQIISEDGSFVSPEYGYISGMKDHVLCRPKGEGTDFVIYDTKGKIVMTYKELVEANDGTIEKKLQDEYSLDDVTYGEGYYVFDLNDGYYYIDETTGKIVLGPYQYAQPFENGRAFVRDEKYAFIIDTNGNPVVKDNYDFINILGNGNFLAKKDTGIFLYDNDGRLIKTFPYYDSMGRYDWGFYIGEYVENSHWAQTVYDNDGNELFTDNLGNWYFADKIPVAYTDATRDDPCTGDKEHIGVWILNLKNGQKDIINDADYAYQFYTIEGTADIPFICVTKYDNKNDTNHQWIYDENLKSRLEYDGYINPSEDRITNEWLLIMSESNGDSSKVYDKNLNEVMAIENYPRVYDGYMTYNDGNAFVGVDKDGNEIFCYMMTGIEGS
ncbi:PstS family phosphate ABC transporter substrate-binding protein [Oribacterium sp. WCC10]|uniref:PstS family phosphate ABC transporter substrate-binding protein n=1 Tax=Oribacterium sp. WCC10 TaxID=1855343 RepID=UPI0008DF734C|nr:substrate-binding domain-containing protein [Oribacterium sp. WCC10]SFG62099.1 ABC-type phosphate transport system, substrate-binding protein [Oribacterium sp. WCC10]